MIKFIYKKLPLLWRLKFSNRITNPYGCLEKKHNIIFVHIPKAAGNGVTKSLFDAPSHGHFGWQDYARDSKRFNLSYKFTVVRNPYSRFVSAYFYLVRGGIGKSDSEFRDKFMVDSGGVNEFIERLASDKRYCSLVLQWTHFKPQVPFIFGGDDLKVDDVFKVEELHREFPLLAIKVGRGGARLSRDNVGGGEGDKVDDILTPKSKSVLYSIYEDDFRRLGYDS